MTIIPALMTKAASVSNPIIYAISHPKYRLVTEYFKIRMSGKVT
jgi:r-opsin